MLWRVEEVGAYTSGLPLGRTLGYIMENKFPGDDSFNDDSYTRGGSFNDDELCGDDLVDSELEHLLWQGDDYFDESYSWGLVRPLSQAKKKRYVEDMYRWDCAPVRSVGEIIAGSCVLIDAQTASDEDVYYALEMLKAALKKHNLFVVFTDHLSDRNLYELIVKQIFPQRIKDFGERQPPTYWDFCAYEEDENKRLHPSDDCEVYLSYFASDQKRRHLTDYCGTPLPARRALMRHRDDRELQEKLCFH